MSFDVFKRIIDEFSNINPDYASSHEVWLHGFGESTLHPQLTMFVDYATQHGVNACLSVNPIMLTKELGLSLLKARPGVLYLSLDGHDDKSFEKIRGLPDIYEKSKKRLLEFIQIKKSLNSSTRLVLSMIDFRLNKESISATLDEWRNTPGLDQVLLKPFTVWDGSVPNVNLFRLRQFEKRPKVTCVFPFEKMSVCWNGNVVPCCYDYDEKYILGNVKDQSLAAIWNGEPMRRLRNEFLENNVTNNLCKNCPELYNLDG